MIVNGRLSVTGSCCKQTGSERFVANLAQNDGRSVDAKKEEEEEVTKYGSFMVERRGGGGVAQMKGNARVERRRKVKKSNVIVFELTAFGADKLIGANFKRQKSSQGANNNAIGRKESKTRAHVEQE